MLLCTRLTSNNSAKRRRPLVFAAKPAIESTENLRKLWRPIRNHMATLKDNTCILHIHVNGEHRCVTLTCDFDKKQELDGFWQKHTKTSISSIPQSLRETEILKLNTCWNLMNHSIDKIYLMTEHVAISSRYHSLPNVGYPEFMICANDQATIDCIFILKFRKRTNDGFLQHENVGVNRIWGVEIELE